MKCLILFSEKEGEKKKRGTNERVGEVFSFSVYNTVFVED